MGDAMNDPDGIREYLRSLEHVTQLSPQQIDELPAIVPLRIAAKAYGLGARVARRMDIEGAFPVPVRSQGRHGKGDKRVVLKADIQADLKCASSVA